MVLLHSFQDGLFGVLSHTQQLIELLKLSAIQCGAN